MLQGRTPSEYRAAIQVPDNFGDPELRQGQVESRPDGLPLNWSGQFAVVFQVRTPAGCRVVRCFTKSITDQQERYNLLHQHIQGRALPMLVAFEYQAQGIRVGQAWYPIVKMERIEGLTLAEQVDTWVASGERERLASLAEHWREMIEVLRQAGIAHGDLQHDNILIQNDTIRLVDYDGVFVPGMAGRLSLELGLEGYQHPARTDARYFDLTMDHFPALVIYLSLRGLAADLSLWKRFHTNEDGETRGDNHLLLLRRDYLDPAQSPALAALKSSPDPVVGMLAQALERACLGPLQAVPSLGEICASTAGPGAPAPPITGPVEEDWRISMRKVWKPPPARSPAPRLVEPAPPPPAPIEYPPTLAQPPAVLPPVLIVLLLFVALVVVGGLVLAGG